MIFFYIRAFACKLHDVIFNSCVIFHCLNVPHFLYSLFGWGHLGCIYVLILMSKSAMNMVEQVSLLQDEVSIEYISKSVITAA